METTKPGTGSTVSGNIPASGNVDVAASTSIASPGILTWPDTTNSYVMRLEVTSSASTLTTSLYAVRVNSAGSDYANAFGGSVGTGTGIKSFATGGAGGFPNTPGTGRSIALTDRLATLVRVQNSSSMTAVTFAYGVGGTYSTDFNTPLDSTGGGPAAPLPASVTVSNPAVHRAANW
jgi:hypothetical protein